MAATTDDFLEAVTRNPWIGEIAARAEELRLPDWCLAAGAVFQTVWNVLDGWDPQRGIVDYDMIYFDDRDVSWEAEDEVIARCADVFADVPVPVEVRNQARVHLWFEDRFGTIYPPVRSTVEAIERYAAVACQVGVRRVDGELQVVAPHGLDDLFSFVLRPNPGVATRAVYEAKSSRWKQLWPRLQVLPWPDDAPVLSV